jgi:hypothetical protein
MRAALCSLMALGLTACATDKAYYDAIEARTRAEQTVAVARAEADKARFAAIAAMGNAGGYSVSSPSLAASGVPGNSLATGGAGGAGAPGGAGGALNC